MSDPVYRHVYGPVPSRRLGRSLGLDVVPRKTCTYECIYCQLGRTTHKTLERAAYAPAADVLEEFRRALDSMPPPDYITVSGSGEPTLNAALEEIVAGVKRYTHIPLVVLTNGSLLGDPAVRAALAPVDVVMPTLGAADETLFRKINRPFRDISFDDAMGDTFSNCSFTNARFSN